MSKSKKLRKLLIGAGILAGTLVVFAVGVSLFFDVNRYKPQIENALAQATGMKLNIKGKATLKVFPKLRVALNDVHLSNAGREFFEAKELEVSPQAVPFLFQRKVIVNKVSLLSPKIHIEKSASGRMNFQTAKTSPPKSSKSAIGGPGGGPVKIGSIRIKNGDLTYKNDSLGQTIQVGGVNVDLSGISWDGQAADTMKSLSFRGDVEAQSLKVATKTGTRTASNLKATVRDDHGFIHLGPTEVNIFGGVTQGNAQIDLRSAAPKIEIAQTASGIDLAQAAPKLKNKLSGSVDGSVKLTGSGTDVQALTKTMSGTISIHSQNVATSVDIDGLAAKLKSAQGMDLVGLGASLLSSPLGEAAGQAAGIAGGSAQPKTAIRKLISDWSINKGIASVKDVAFSTAKTTVAFKGDLNLIDKKYQNFYVATVDQQGCVKNKVEVGGPLDRPRPVAGSVGKQLSESYLGSAGSALGSTGSQIAGIFGGKEEPKAGTSPAPKKGSEGCDQFYSGSAINAG